MPTSPSRLPAAIFRYAWRLAVIVLAIWLIRVTLRSSDADILSDVRQADWHLLGLAALIYGTIQLLAVWRWQLLMDVQGMHLPLLLAFRLTMIGNFFSMFIPGSVSGDVLKIAYAGRCFPGRKTGIALTVLLDRIIGLAAIFFAALLATVSNLDRLRELFTSHPTLGLAIIVVNAGCIACLLAYALYRCQEHLLALPLLQSGSSAIMRRLPHFLSGILSRLRLGLDMYKKRQTVLGAHALISVLIHVCNGACFYTIGKALGEHAMTAREYLLSTQVAVSTGIIPLTPGGIGTRDAVSAAFFQAFAADPAEVAGSIPVVYSFILLLWGVIAAGVFICSPTLRQVSAAEQRSGGDALDN
ncbi:MAG: flippase-like domain-containing protein [Oligosphaeraceae bacterium]|nr:flippase-like domain-containing protein [Oligosphaeraceae bacterium]